MSYNTLTPGAHCPHEFTVVIEISAEGPPVKYEVEKDSGLLWVDRFMPVAMHYPVNYGYVPATLAGDGDPVDVLVLTPHPVQAGCVLSCRPVGMLKMADEKGEDNKVIAVPTAKVCVEYADVKALADISSLLQDRIVHFFNHYKALEANKWVKVSGWEDVPAAIREITDSVARYHATECVD